MTTSPLPPGTPVQEPHISGAQAVPMHAADAIEETAMPADANPPDATPVDVTANDTRRSDGRFKPRNPRATEEQLAERAAHRAAVGGDMQFAVPSGSMSDPTRHREKPGRKAKRGLNAKGLKAARLEQARIQSGRRQLTATVPVHVIAYLREYLNLVLRQERELSNYLAAANISYDDLVRCIAVVAPKFRVLLAQHADLWMQVPARKPGAKSERLPIDNPLYVAWAAKGEEILAFVDAFLRNMDFETRFAMQACIGHMREHDEPPSPQHLASKVTDHAMKQLRRAKDFGEETLMVKTLADQGDIERMTLPKGWDVERPELTPAAVERAAQKNLESDRLNAKAQANKAKAEAAQAAQEERQAALDAIVITDQHIKATTTLPPEIVNAMTAPELMQRMQFLSNLPRESISSEAYAALNAEFGGLNRRHQELHATTRELEPGEVDVTVRRPLAKAVVATLEPDQAIARMKFIASIDINSIEPETYKQLAAEHAALTARLQRMNGGQ